MTKEQAWEALAEMMTVNDFYSTEDGDLNYLLGYIDALRDMVMKGACSK